MVGRDSYKVQTLVRFQADPQKIFKLRGRMRHSGDRYQIPSILGLWYMVSCNCSSSEWREYRGGELRTFQLLLFESRNLVAGILADGVLMEPDYRNREDL